MPVPTPLSPNPGLVPSLPPILVLVPSLPPSPAPVLTPIIRLILCVGYTTATTDLLKTVRGRTMMRYLQRGTQFKVKRIGNLRPVLRRFAALQGLGMDSAKNSLSA